MKTIYAAYQNRDLTEGRGGQDLKALFVNKQDADIYNASLPGVMGTKNDCAVRSLILFESPAEAESYNTAEAFRLRTLAKLTLKERKALGLA